jgi:hypothetical protein
MLPSSLVSTVKTSAYLDLVQDFGREFLEHQTVALRVERL